MAEEVVTKYSNLPFIDKSGKDVFEAGSDNVYEEVNYDVDKDVLSDDIDQSSINQKGSFNMFKDKFVDSSGIDFSDRIKPNSGRAGYQSKTVYEMIGEQVAKETPQQKYQRLQHELHELSEEVATIKDPSADEAAPVELAKQVSNLEKQLQSLHLEKILGTSQMGATGHASPSSWIKQVEGHLQSVRARPTTQGADSTSDGSSVKYEMYYRPEHTNFAQTSKMADLEKKVQFLEKIIGTDTNKYKSVISDVAGSQTATLMEASTTLHTKLSLLDLSHVDIIAARLQGLLHAINEVSQKRDSVENVDKQTKVSELYDLVGKWDQTSCNLPDILERLKAIKSLNEQASAFAHTYEHMQATQTEVRDQLRDQKQVLSKLEESLGQNVQSIQQNCQTLETRITTLMQDVGKS